MDLERRLREYFNINYLERKETMYICRSLLLNGYSNTSFEVLEDCDPSLLLKREKWYFELLKPQYNIAKEPGSPMLGRNHSEEAKTLISEARKGQNHPLFGQNHSEETQTKMSFVRFLRHKETFKTCGAREAHKAKTLSEETKAKISEARGQVVEVLDIETNEKTTYSSGRQAAKALGCDQKTVCYYIKSKKLFQGRYLIGKFSSS